MNSFGLSKQDTVILYIGRFDWQRGVYDLIYTTRKLLDDHELMGYPIKVIFVGQGEEFEGMKWLVSRLNLEKFVIFQDRFPYEKIHNVYRMADIFVFPSIPMRYIKEQFGLAIVEAMASGIPVVSTLCGSIPEIVGDAGILVQPNDPPSLYQGIKKLILDRELRERLCSMGRERIEEAFNPDKNAQLIEQIFKSILNG